MSAACVFCRILEGSEPAHIVFEDERTVVFVDLRQANWGHTLVIPRTHVNDVRELHPDDATALMATLVRATRAVSTAFPSEGISIWSSIGPAAFQEVPHLHLHVHPRHHGDELLRIYPDRLEDQPPDVLAEIAGELRPHFR